MMLLLYNFTGFQNDAVDDSVITEEDVEHRKSRISHPSLVWIAVTLLALSVWHSVRGQNLIYTQEPETDCVLIENDQCINQKGYCLTKFLYVR